MSPLLGSKGPYKRNSLLHRNSSQAQATKASLNWHSQDLAQPFQIERSTSAESPETHTKEGVDEYISSLMKSFSCGEAKRPVQPQPTASSKSSIEV